MRKKTLGLIYVPHPNKKSALKTAKFLLQHKLIACANIIDKMTSLYEWKGKMKQDKEVLLLGKTYFSNFTKIKKSLASVHPYEVPCLTIIKLDQINELYRLWLEDSMK